MHKGVLHWIAWVLVVIGGLNWGLVGLFNFDVVQALGVPMLATIIYVLVGLAALWMIFAKFMKKGRRK
ncbi:MAG TPA: DUF378 domain-containing protein [Patescibacteria group bacterium]|nr:DUF378 domain-containing protein [Patescibacteria group bacterium]